MKEFYEEHDVTDPDKDELMDLLELCFPMLKDFKTSLYWREQPAHYRWLIRDKDKIVANICVLDKTFLSGTKKISIAGIAYVCVHPEYRRRGFVKQMMSEIHQWAQDRGYAFAFLFGRTEHYQSSGYIRCKNQFKFINYSNNTEEVKQIDKAHYVPLQDQPMPESVIDVQGPIF